MIKSNTFHGIVKYLKFKASNFIPHSIVNLNYYQYATEEKNMVELPKNSFVASLREKKVWDKIPNRSKFRRKF